MEERENVQFYLQKLKRRNYLIHKHCVSMWSLITNNSFDEDWYPGYQPNEGPALTQPTIQKILEDYGVLPKAQIAISVKQASKDSHNYDYVVTDSITFLITSAEAVLTLKPSSIGTHVL